MRKFLRLLRYGLPYTLEWLPGVMLSALVGVLDTFRILLLQPIFDRVLARARPKARSFSVFQKSQWHFDLQEPDSAFPAHAQRLGCRGLCAGRLDASKGPVRLSGNLSGQLRGLRHNYRSAQSPLRNYAAPLLELLPQASHRHHPFHAHQRRGPGADCAEFCAGRFSAAVLHFRGGDRSDHQPGRVPQLGAGALHSGGDHLGAQDRPRSPHPHAHRPGQAGRGAEHPARNGDGQPHREVVQHRAVGDSALQERGQAALPRQPAQRAHSVHQFAADGYSRRDRHGVVAVGSAATRSRAAT